MIWKTAFHSLESCVSWQGEQSRMVRNWLTRMFHEADPEVADLLSVHSERPEGYRWGVSEPDFRTPGTPPPYPIVCQRAGAALREVMWAESGSHLEKQLLMRVGAGEQEAHAPGITQDHRADLEQLQADRRHLGPGQLRALERQPADPFHQHIGQ